LLTFQNSYAEALALPRASSRRRSRPLDCANDGEAMEKAKSLVENHNVELWDHARKVASFKAECETSGRAITHRVRGGQMISRPAE
jgi:hypothetical protein